jgi:hypothetical protein
MAKSMVLLPFTTPGFRKKVRDSNETVNSVVVMPCRCHRHRWGRKRGRKCRLRYYDSSMNGLTSRCPAHIITTTVTPH